MHSWQFHCAVHTSLTPSPLSFHPAPPRPPHPTHDLCATTDTCSKQQENAGKSPTAKKAEQQAKKAAKNNPDAKKAW